MEQILHYRDVRYVVGTEHCQQRTWTIYPVDGPSCGAATGVVGTHGLRGSFKAGVMAARGAIDAWLDGDPAKRGAALAELQSD